MTNWELGHSSPNFRSLPAIIDFLGYDPRPEAVTFGQTLKRYRKGKGISQGELAATLRVDPSTLARWERDERLPGCEFLSRVQEALRAR